jgi:hypothetical protein
VGERYCGCFYQLVAPCTVGKIVLDDIFSRYLGSIRLLVQYTEVEQPKSTTGGLTGDFIAWMMLGIGNTGCIFRRGDSIFRDDDRLIATEEG